MFKMDKNLQLKILKESFLRNIWRLHDFEINGVIHHQIDNRYLHMKITTSDGIFWTELEWGIICVLTPWKGCKNVANKSHSKYWEWP